MEVIKGAKSGFLSMYFQPTCSSSSSCLNKSRTALPIHHQPSNNLPHNYGVSNLMQTLPSYASSSPVILRRHLPRGCCHHWNFARRRERAASSAWVMDSESALAPDVEDLRKQLETLQEEAQQAMKRANNARARFMRLSDVVEQLRLRAALDVKFDNEDSARLLLQEKRNVMRALEISRKRAELFEELSSKLREAISRKESELIAALSCARLDLDAEINDFDGNVRVISPTHIDFPFAVDLVEQGSTLSIADGVRDVTKEGMLGSTATEESNDSLQKGSVADVEADINVLNPQVALLEREGMYEGRKSLDRGISYKAFLLDIDHSIAAIEGKLQQFMDAASILIESGGTKAISDRIHTVRLLLQHIKELRTRILEAIGSSPSSRSELL